MRIQRPVALKVPKILGELVREVGVDKVPRLAAALAYFGLFAMPALLALVLAVAGSVFGFDAVKDRILGQFGSLAGKGGADVVRDMLVHVDPSRKASFLAQALGIGALLFGATGFMLQLQDALNTMWGAKGNAKKKGVVAVVLKRLFSLGMLMTVGLLLLASLALTAGLSALGDGFARLLGSGASGLLVGALDAVVATAAIALLFAIVFKFVPDLKIEWREVWVGAGFTALLVVAGKWALGLYFGRSDPGATFGAAGPLAVLLLWTYYFALMVLIGAEFTQVYARLYGPRRVERARRLEAKAGRDGEVPRAKSPARA
jgi:membrane protein